MGPILAKLMVYGKKSVRARTRARGNKVADGADLLFLLVEYFTTPFSSLVFHCFACLMPLAFIFKLIELRFNFLHEIKI